LLELLGASGRQRALAEARRRLDDGKSLGGEFGQDRDEPGTCDQPAESCRQNFGREEWQLSPGRRGSRPTSDIARSRLDQELPLIAVSAPPIRGVLTVMKVYDLY
jgi:hypothetical protein